jgi:hypothetical protein
MNGIWLSTDTELHVTVSDGTTCKPCHPGYPKAHEGCRHGGYLHAAQRFDMEAGFETKYLITRCDKCGKEGLVE